jgi:membrane-bound ClpP family serine protease
VEREAQPICYSGLACNYGVSRYRAFLVYGLIIFRYKNYPMDAILLVCGIVLLLVSFIGIMKTLLRLAAIICLIAGVWFWFNGGREKIEAGKQQLMEHASGLVDEEKVALEGALANPGALLDSQKPRLREIVSKLSESAAIDGNQEAKAALEKLKAGLEKNK